MYQHSVREKQLKHLKCVDTIIDKKRKQEVSKYTSYLLIILDVHHDNVRSGKIEKKDT